MSSELTNISHSFGELEAQRIELLAELPHWPAGRINFRPALGAWSAMEVLDHIVRAEAGAIAEVRKGLRNPQTPDMEDRPKIAALDRALRSNQRFLMPPDAGEIRPDAHTALPEVVDRWEKVRAELRSLLQELTPADTRGGVFRHPFAGWMTVAEVLNHFSAHVFHHCFQLARLREE